MRKRFMLVIGAAVMLAGCVPSLHELYTKETLVYDEGVLGKWDTGEEIWEFSKGEKEKSYKLVITEEDGVGEFIVHLVKLDGKLFFDMFPEEVENVSGWTRMHLIGAHTFLKVESIAPVFAIRAMGPDTVEKLLKEKPEEVKHEIVDDRVILTAGPEELQKFIIKYVDAEEFFGDIGEFKKYIPKDPNEPSVEE